MASYPWSLPPFPTIGDATATELYAAKGRAVSYWEGVEVALGLIYAALSSRPRHDPVARQEYGAAANFKDRLNGLERKADIVFRFLCDQALEGRFYNIAESARQFSVRRNEIAHSIIEPAQFFRRDQKTLFGEQWLSEHAFYLLPPEYTGRKFDEKNMPMFIYTSKEVMKFAGYFLDLRFAAETLAQHLEAQLRTGSLPQKLP